MSAHELWALLAISQRKLTERQAKMPVAKLAVRKLIRLHLIEEANTYPWHITEKGLVYLKALADVPMPIQKPVLQWVIPE